ncbi:structural maintenance of chromosome protein 3 [Heliocybe sulcata]|uniref:Structural maintenance of chromosomes protein n=1 Tax=Heliocybe sulcata TaxID=5364 RepID=A0A5C3N905_9AGAM|nr:structural maintenance of chromosome protein 3 [Heliocybe sulcata]
MYIKTLTIQGFKSYRDQTQIEPFSPRHNVVVGRNGSGKSNFFAAIRFVLSDAYTSMSREERQSLLHEGVSTTTTLSAYVEIVFDNSDNRFPTGREEVIIRRTIGLKKDEYSLDKKSVSKADVMNLLESAGFSKSNPYYIVPQGRITALTNAKDHERLALLKEVAGTKVYEQRRTESLRLMSETDAKRSKITELLDYINSRLTELEEEKEELKEFQEKDKERRCLEYAVYQRELVEVGDALEEIEEERKVEVHSANNRREEFSKREKDIQRIEKEIADAKHTLSTQTLTRQGVQSELADLYRARTELECVVTDLRASTELSGGRKDAMQAELQRIEKEITAKERTLATLTPQWEELRARETQEKRALDEARARLEGLNSKRGRLTRFRTKPERDAFLTQEIASIDAYRRTHAASLQTTRSTLASVQQTLHDLETRARAAQDKVEDGRKRQGELESEIGRMKDQHAELVERRKEGWREDTKLETLVRHAQEELRGAERDLAGMMDKDTGMGLRAIDRIAERHQLDGVYGPLYRLFDITEDKYNTAVELTAGNSLFHVVVDSDATASKVLDIMLREKTGRVTFMPLNRLKPKNPPLPSSVDAIPLIDQLRFDSEFEKAFQQVFGKTCVCKDLSIAAAYVKSHNINTITMDGDKVDRKGALTGGYHDVRRSRIEAIRSVGEWKGKYEAHEKRSREVRKEIVQLDQQITQAYGRVQVLQTQLAQAQEARQVLAAELSAIGQEKRRLKERKAKLEAEIEEGETELAGLEAKLDGYRAEMASPMAKGLTEEEEDVISNLVKEVETRQRQLGEVKRQRSDLGTKKEIIEIELEETLRRRREELREKVQLHGDSDLGSDASEDTLKARTRELRSLNASIDSLVKRTQELDKETDELSSRLQKLRADLQKAQDQRQEDNRGISKQQKSTERYLAKRQMLMGRKEECSRNIRDLGVLPEEAFEKYTNEKLDRLVKKLHSVNQGLKKFAHVNKKAFEQYSNFTKQRDQLLQRREDLDKSAESIQDLVEVLDQRKDEAIERTFKQVASNFEDVFEKLVPAGRGKLIIQRRIDRDEDDAEDDAEDAQQSSVDNYTGVSIKVSFNSKVDEGLRIQQLSGGQKSLVALATVFAIQQCDPAPFYLFDEIDANLDAQYRTAVASMIQSLSSTAQFIVTTFRPEMLHTADKFYGVLFNNQKISSIRSIKREEAMEFVEQEAQAQ